MLAGTLALAGSLYNFPNFSDYHFYHQELVFQQIYKFFVIKLTKSINIQ